MAYTPLPAEIPTFAYASGSTVVPSFTVTSALWQQNVTDGSTTYGVIRYAAPGVDLSSVVVGHKLNVPSGFSNAENNTSGLMILNFNNTDKWIDVKSFERLSNSLDETGVSATGATITTAGARVTKPSAGVQGQGLLSPQKPSDGLLNWLFNRIGQSINMLHQNYPVGYLLGARLTAGNNVSLTNNGDNTLRLDATFNVSIVPSIGETFTQSSHGFAIGTPIRRDSSTWIAAQGTSIAGCSDVWVVVAVPTTNTFTAVQKGRYTIAATTAGAGATSLVANTLYYLSTTAGAVTATKPVGGISQPLGFYLPLFFVESVGGGQAVIHVLGQGFPTIDELLIDYVVPSNLNEITLSNLDIATHGSYRVEFEFGVNNNSSQIYLASNGESYSTPGYTNQMTTTQNTTSTHSYTTTPQISTSGSGGSGVIEGTVFVRRLNATSNDHYFSSRTSYSLNGITIQTDIHRANAANLTSLRFHGVVSPSGPMILAGSTIRLYRGR